MRGAFFGEFVQCFRKVLSGFVLGSALMVIDDFLDEYNVRSVVYIQNSYGPVYRPDS